ncbi:MAG: cytochrome c, partial [Xanthobacteraceae bacterium]
MRWRFVVGMILAVPFAGPPSVGPARAQDTAAQEKRGEALVSRHCSMCHATGRTGSSTHAEAPPFRTLSRKYPIASLEEALGEGIISGHPDMPEFKFPPGDVGAIVAYLTSI